MLQTILEENYQFIPLQEEASTRKYYHAKDTLGKEYVLCKDSQGINWDFVELTKFFLEKGFPVPKILGMDSKKGMLLLEFCGWKDLTSLSEEEYESRLETLIEFILDLQNTSPPSIVANRFFDFEKLKFEVDTTWTALQKWKETKGTKFHLVKELQFFLYEVCDYLGRYSYFVFTHRDFHSRNILIHPNPNHHSKYGNLVIIDYQDARMGTPAYDLCSLLYDAYRELPLDTREKYLKIYQSKVSYPQFRQTYYLQALQRSFKALGTYLNQVLIKNHLKFYPSILHCLKNLMEISQIGKFPDSIYIFADSFLLSLEKEPVL